MSSESRPAWVRRLEEALRQARDPDPAREGDGVTTPLDFAELKRQLQEWDRPLGE